LPWTGVRGTREGSRREEKKKEAAGEASFSSATKERGSARPRLNWLHLHLLPVAQGKREEKKKKKKKKEIRKKGEKKKKKKSPALRVPSAESDWYGPSFAFLPSPSTA